MKGSTDGDACPIRRVTLLVEMDLMKVVFRRLVSIFILKVKDCVKDGDPLHPLARCRLQVVVRDDRGSGLSGTGRILWCVLWWPCVASLTVAIAVSVNALGLMICWQS